MKEPSPATAPSTEPPEQKHGGPPQPSEDPPTDPAAREQWEKDCEAYRQWFHYSPEGYERFQQNQQNQLQACEEIDREFSQERVPHDDPRRMRLDELRAKELTHTEGKIHPTFNNVRCVLARWNVLLWKDLFTLQKKVIWKDNRPDCSEREPRIWNDDDFDSLWTQLGQPPLNLKIRKDTLHSWINVIANENARHPVADYLVSLEWDHHRRVDHWLSDYFYVEDNEYTRAIGRLWLVAAVRRIFHPGATYQEMLVFESNQGKGKSLGLRALCPNPKWFSDSLRLGVGGKEVLEQTLGKWIVEAGEMVSRSSVEEVKGFLSRDVDEARMAFGREVVRRERQFVMAGSCNPKATGYLEDQTGNRRFQPVTCGPRVDVAGIHRDRDQLWAEAVHLEATDMSIRLDPSLYAAAAREQEKRRKQSAVEEVLEGLLADYQDCRITTKNLAEVVGGRFPIEEARDAMVRIGFEGNKPADWFGKTAKCWWRGNGTVRLEVHRSVVDNTTLQVRPLLPRKEGAAPAASKPATPAKANLVNPEALAALFGKAKGA
jgi:predicted P-loop ATPase